MDIRSVPRRILNTQLKIARAPFDRVLGQNPAVDAAEATIRDTVGTLLRDDTLRQDAALQRAKAEELREAAKHMTEAQRTRQEADAQYQQRIQEAEQERQEAERQTQEQKAKVEQERQAKTRQVREETARKKAQTQKVAQAREERIREEETAAQLKAAAAEAEALEAKQGELTIREEADRLEKAASNVRARRKT